LYFKSEPSDVYLTAEIQNRMKLRAKSAAEDADLIGHHSKIQDATKVSLYHGALSQNQPLKIQT
jgi:hypothetical protein